MHYKKLFLLSMALASPATVIATGKSPWSVEMETGVGYDSNVYLAPKDSYVDYAPTVPQTVDPVIRSGTFIPLGVDVAFDGRGKDGRRGFIGSYSFYGNFYPDSKTENANEYNHTVTAGMEFLLNQRGPRRDTVSVTPYVGVHDKTYFNRDTGDAMESNAGTDLSDRYSYNVTGLKAEFKHETSRLPHALHAEVATLDYVEPSSTTFDSYDHDYLLVGGEIEFSLAKPSRLVLSYDYFTRDYEERKARDLSGDSVPGTTREYIYNKVGASLRQKLNDDFSLFLDYDITDRKDQHVGYHDYTQHGYGVRAVYSDGKRIRVKAKASWWNRDYDNAFAFDNPTQKRMNYKSAKYLVKGDYALNKHHGVWTEWKMVDQTSTDLRYEYDRYQVMAGWRWGM